MRNIVPLTPYRASDRRVYDGAPCSDMQREIDRTRDLRARMEAASSNARCVYSPMEGKYLIFLGYHELTGCFHDNIQEALIEAIGVLERKVAR